MVEQGLAAAAVLCLLGVALWVLRAKGMAHFKTGVRRKAGVLTAMDRLPLDPQHSIHAIRVADRVLLIAVSPSACSLLETLPWKMIEDGQGSGLERT
jgi:flagellar biogenesis protein FliO